MNLTYNEILKNMKNTFFEESGKNVDLLSDLGIRFQAVASEIYAVSCYGDYILKQSFPATASGIYLDNHGIARGITRKTASKATGLLTFFVDTVLEEDVSIPLGTICSVSGSPYIQFATTEAGTITAGNTSTTIGAEALATGENYNAKASTIIVMLNPPTSVASVSNSEDFTGGYSLENDENYRNRILNSYSVYENGVNKQSIAEVILEFDYVVDCFVSLTSSCDTIDVFVKTKSGNLSQEQKSELESSIGIAEISGKTFNVSHASENQVNVHIEAYSDTSNSDIENYVVSCVNSFFLEEIGKTINVSEIMAKILENEHISDCEIYCDGTIKTSIIPLNGCYSSLGDVEVCINI